MNTISPLNRYRLKPFIIPADIAHKEKIVSYDNEGIATINLPALKVSAKVNLDHQFSYLRSTFDDLNKAISALSNSPVLEDGKTLRQKFQEEADLYETLSMDAFSAGDWEVSYGTYVFDHIKGDLYHIAPQFWHRLALVTSPAKLLVSPKNKLSWVEIKSLFEGKVVGFVGASVGGGVLEGWLREGRPLKVKIADPDWLDATNLSRAERGSIRHLGGNKALKDDPKNPFDTPRINKAEYTAYEQNLVDPYLETYIYSEGISERSIEQFIMGDGKDEPKIDVLVEETDDLELKIAIRVKCKKMGIPVLMMSDFGYQVQCQFQDFKSNPNQTLGYKVTDEELMQALEEAKILKTRESRFELIRKLCGFEFEKDSFGEWIKGEGEQPTSSLPQSGATAMVSGGIGGHVLARYFLGYEIPERFIFDISNIEATIG